MNILIFSLKGPSSPEGGGAGEVIRALSKKWVEMGHYVRIITTRPSLTYPVYEETNGIEIIRKGSLYTAIPLFVKEYTTHKKWADTIIENITSYPLFTPLYSRPSLVIIHVIKGKTYFKVQPFLKAFIGFLSEKLIPMIYNKTKFVAVSDSTRNSLIKLGIRLSQIKVIPNGVDTDIFVPSQKSDYPLILYLGKLDKRKNVKDLIIAFKYIVHKNPRAKLLIAGDGPERMNLEELASNIPNISFLGFVSEDEKIKLYQKAWVYVLPSLKEGFPLSFLEANACGTPVVTYAVEGTEYIENYRNGLRVENKNPLALASTISHIIENQDVLTKMSKCCRKKALEYSWENIARLYLKYIEENEC